ncbi:hypothetical protein NE237_032999 [Protea cynaroides]|uniref:Uncharacterized protein n=1 Tax=Protea cynaroides TaxID=273540 RepID=A0A9Q0L463_9MAGN|nr:hypothetical protein NE237_032999 [Protea cynaroides]
MQNNPDQSMRHINSVENNRSNMDSKDIQSKKLKNSVFVSRKGNQMGGGTNILLYALAAYLRYLEGTARDDWQEMLERVYFEAITYEREHNAGFLLPFRYSLATVAAAVNAVCLMEGRGRILSYEDGKDFQKD